MATWLTLTGTLNIGLGPTLITSEQVNYFPYLFSVDEGDDSDGNLHNEDKDDDSQKLQENIVIRFIVKSHKDYIFLPSQIIPCKFQYIYEAR